MTEIVATKLLLVVCLMGTNYNFVACANFAGTDGVVPSDGGHHGQLHLQDERRREEKTSDTSAPLDIEI